MHLQQMAFLTIDSNTLHHNSLVQLPNNNSFIINYLELKATGRVILFNSKLIVLSPHLRNNLVFSIKTMMSKEKIRLDSYASLLTMCQVIIHNLNKEGFNKARSNIKHLEILLNQLRNHRIECYLLL
jgi:hypothetical protein